MRTGIETSPNDNVPDPIEWAGIWFSPGWNVHEAIIRLCYPQRPPSPTADVPSPDLPAAEALPAVKKPEPHPNLEDYRRKRDPARTPEPFGPDGDGAGDRARGAAWRVPFPDTLPGPQFVVQKHWATSMHYDLRLALDGTLRSWAVPKGPSTHVEEKRLAVHVEDHPLEYADFEGVIPAGNYGAGSVIVWDRGWYGSFKPEPLSEQYERGKLELELHGFKLRGRWTLVRMGGRGKGGKEWLLLKKADGAATEDEMVDRYPESVISGLSVEEMKDARGAVAALRDRVEALGAPRRELPREVPFTLATLAEHAPQGAEWSFEIKYDGVRVLARRDGERVALYGRSGEDITARYPEIAAGIAGLAVPRFALDGEIVAEDERGRPSFQRLQARMHLKGARNVLAALKSVPARGMFFDILSLEGHDLRDLPLADRQELLARVLPPIGPVQRVGHVIEHGPAFYDAASELGLEGIVAKRRNGRYEGRRSAGWLKIKCQKRQEFVIGGMSPGQGGRAGFGALHVGVYEGDRLVYVTKVGTGFDDATLASVARALEPLRRDTSPFQVRSPAARGHVWCEPRLVCEVRFTEWTRDGGLRHPTFLGLRADVRPEDCRREAPPAETVDEDGEESGNPIAVAGADPDRAAPRSAKSRAPRARGAASTPARVAAAPAPAPAPAPPRVPLTNLRKVFWPDGTTKGDLIAYYDAVAPLMLRYLRDRPAVLTRYPDGIDGKSFFQKDAPVYVPDWVRTEVIAGDEGSRDIRYFVLDDAESLRYVANLGTIPIHAWSARIGSLEHPDWMVIDLDPKGAPFTHVVQVARVVKDVLDELKLPGYPKTSGASGLHVLVPMGRRYTHSEVRTFARLIAMLVVEEVPEISTVARAIQARGGKVYVDFGQNGHGITIAAPFSARPVPAASASCPLRWDEVTARLDPARFNLRTIPERFAGMDDPLQGVMGEGIDMAAAIARIEKRMAAAAKTRRKATGS
jgi:bifunctional non-homologous end joining protein LigD